MLNLNHSRFTKTEIEAFGLAILVEVTILMFLFYGAVIFNWNLEKKVDQTLIELVTLDQKKPDVLEPKPPTPPPKPQPKLLLPKLPTPVVKTQNEPVPNQLNETVSDQVSAFSTQVQPVKTNTNTSVDPMLLYAAQVKSAVQASVIYPLSARTMNLSGRVRVQFSLTDGAPSAAQVISSSGYAMLDNAAIATIQSTRYPIPPEAFLHQIKSFQIWVEFNR
jgi:TonB family protein